MTAQDDRKRADVDPLAAAPARPRGEGFIPSESYAQDQATFTLSADGHIVTWNVGATRLYGYWPEEIVGHPVARLRSADDIDGGGLPEDLLRAAADGRAEIEGWRFRWDGSKFWASVLTVAIRDATGSLRGFSQTTRDITARRRAEESTKALSEVGRVLASSLDAAKVGQRIADEIRALLGSRGAALFRLSPESGELRAMAVAGDLTCPLSQLVLKRGIGAPCLAVRERCPVVVRDILTDTRIPLTVEMRLSAVRSPSRAFLAVPLMTQGRVVGALAVFDRAGRVFDVAETRLAQAFGDQAALGLENARLYRQSVRAYEELLRAQEHLAQAQKIEAVSRLAGGIAHDFNNLLTVITASTQLLLNRLSPIDVLRKDIEVIDKAARNAAALTGQLLTFSRKHAMRTSLFDLNQTIDGIIPMLRRLMGERIEVVALLEPTLPLIQADPGRVEQVLLNLALNARDAMPRGGRVTIETTNVAGPASERRDVPGVMLTLHDTGTGMTPAILSRVFEPFFTTKDPGKGTGLGLAVVYGIVKQSGGDISVDSAPGQGTTVRISLPAAAQSAPAPADTRDSPPLPRGSATILLVEDDGQLRAALSAGLEAHGYTVIAAGDGREALEISDRYEDVIQVLLADVVLPLFSGRELDGLLRTSRPALRTLFMSGYSDEAGAPPVPAAANFIEKPFTLGALLRKLRELIDAPGR